MNAIQTDSLTKYYGKSRGITDVSLTVGEGDFFGFIGPNGAGKSTTIRILLGLIAPTAGSAEIFGKDIRRQKEAILSEIGYMPSEASFYPHMRVREVIKLSADLRKRDCKKEAAALCDRLSLDTEKRVRELSLGNRKKVSIVCALQHDPRLCILDEPTSGLDPTTAVAIHRMLLELKEQGMAIFLTTHNMEEATKLCDRVALLHDGEIVEFGSPQEICLKYNRNKKYHVLLAGGREMELAQNPENIVKITRWMEGDEIMRIHSCEPTLETVFLEVTGKDLNV